MVIPGDEGKGKEGDEGKAGGEELKQLQADLVSRQEELDGLKTAKEDLEGKLEDAEGELLSPEYLKFREDKGKGTQTPPGGEGDVKLEDMTPVEIAKHFANSTKGDLEKSITSLTQQIKEMGEMTGKGFAQLDLMVTANKHSELDDALKTPSDKKTTAQKELLKELFATSKENPNWNTERCLRTAKTNIKMKADELVEAEKAKALADNKMISEKPGQSSAVVKEKSMSKTESVHKAWDAIMGSKESLT